LGQIPLAVVIAIPLRANILVAVTATLVTNPITFPFIYLLAHRLGSTTLAAVGSGGDDMDRYAISGLFAPLVTGLMLLGVLSAAVGFAGCSLLWRYWVQSQRRRRATTRLNGSPVSSPNETNPDVSRAPRYDPIEPPN